MTLGASSNSTEARERVSMPTIVVKAVYDLMPTKGSQDSLG